MRNTPTDRRVIGQITIRNQAMKQVIVACLLLCPLFVYGQRIWDDGGADSDWSTAGNWDADTALVSGNTLYLRFSNLGFKNTNVDLDYTVNKIDFQGANGAYTHGSTGSKTITMDGTNAIISNNTSYNQKFTAAVDLAADLELEATTSSSLLTFTIAMDLGSSDLTISGDGVVEINNTISSTGSTINVNGGTFVKKWNNRIDDDININMNGGKFKTGGTDDVMGTLTLSSDSVIDMESGDSVIEFSDFVYSGGYIDIYNWTGDAFTGGGTDQIIFSSLSADLSDNTNKFRFFSDNGITMVSNVGYLVDLGGGRYELTAVPEASQVIACASLVLFAVWWRRRKAIQHAGKAGGEAPAGSA